MFQTWVFRNKWSLLAGVLIVIIFFSWLGKNNTPVQDWPKEIDFVAEVTLPNSNIVNVGVANTEEKRTQGLAGVVDLASNEGMWFVFDQLGYYAFWMRGTVVSLDIIWLDDNFIIVDIKRDLEPAGEVAVPLTYQNTRPAMYVLELLGGIAQKNNLGIGDQLKFKRI